MSFEQLIGGLTAAIQANTAALQAMSGETGSRAAPAFAPQQTAPAGPPTGMPGAPFAGAGAPPNFGAPAPAQAPPCPITDAKTLTDYATNAYYALEAKGAGRGAAVDPVIKSLGGAQLGDLTPDKYPPFYQAVEALKAQP